MSTRIEREKRTVALMIEIYCRRKHNAIAGLCPECMDLLDYAHKRLDLCPKGDAKTSCRKCEIHCYAPLRKQQIREVMRYVGPRMIYLRPVDAVRHILTEIFQ